MTDTEKKKLPYTDNPVVNPQSAENLQTLRKYGNLTFRQLEEGTGINIAILNFLFHGKRMMSRKSLIGISRFLNCEQAYVRGDSDVGIKCYLKDNIKTLKDVDKDFFVVSNNDYIRMCNLGKIKEEIRDIEGRKIVIRICQESVLDTIIARKQTQDSRSKQIYIDLISYKLAKLEIDEIEKVNKMIEIFFDL